MKAILGIITSCLLLSGCAPYINAGNKYMVTVYAPATYYEAEALALADEHCAKYGMTAKLRKPRDSSGYGNLYDYNCVK